jgi:hypothetical protein
MATQGLPGMTVTAAVNIAAIAVFPPTRCSR